MSSAHLCHRLLLSSSLNSSHKPFSKAVSCIDFGRNTRRTCLVVKSSSGLKGRDDEEASVAVKEEAVVENSSGFWLNRGNLAGIERFLDRASKWLLMATFWVVIFWKPEARSLWAILGNFINLRISTTLKHIVNQERPVPGLRMDPGMPSSHAQSFFFTIPFAIMSLVEHLGANVVSLTIGGLATASASYLSWLRIVHGLHTISQVVMGAILGLSYWIFWFWWWDAMVQEAFCCHLWIRLLVISLVTFFCSTFVVYVIQSVLRFKLKVRKDFEK